MFNSIKTMATAKKTTRTATTAAAKKAAAPAKKAAPAAAAPMKPIKTALNKTTLAAHVAGAAGVEPKVAKAVLGALEETMLASLNKRGLGEFTLPGLLKVVVQKVPAKKKRFGKDPFTGEERWFPAKPASVKVKVRPMKKIKDAAA